MLIAYLYRATGIVLMSWTFAIFTAVAIAYLGQEVGIISEIVFISWAFAIFTAVLIAYLYRATGRPTCTG